MESSIIYTLNSLVYDSNGELITEEKEIPKIPRGTKIKIYIKMSRQMGSSEFKDEEFTVYICDEVKIYQERDKYPFYMFSVLFENKKPLYSTHFWIKYCPVLSGGLQIEIRTPSRVNDFEELRIVYSDPYLNKLQLARRKLAFSKLLHERLSSESLVIELPLDIIEECIVKKINSYGRYIGNLDDISEEDDSHDQEDEDQDGFGGGGVRPKKKKRKSKKQRKKTKKRKSKRKKHKTKRRKS